ncbi:MAG: formyltransferase family protein [Chloroflexota bacterium]|nr:formyltransferase family protein [Chloroflexota bacterium]
MNLKNNTLSVGWLSTGNGEGSLGLLEQGIDLHNEKKISIEYVFTNRNYGEQKGSDKFIEFVKKNKIKIITYSSKDYKSQKQSSWKDLRNDFDKEVLSKISKYKTDIIIAAGYMLFSPVICNYFKILNIHPALPNGPNGTWKNVIKDLILTDAQTSGISIHLMTPDLDEGPNISFCEFQIKNELNLNLWRKINRKNEDIETSELFIDIRKKIITHEKALLKKTLEKISNKEIDIIKHNFVNLSDEVNKIL